nr:proton-conducting transporter membrane subunit [Planctomycetota bacterium]
FVLLAQAGGSTSISVLAERSAEIGASPLYLPALVLILLGAFTKSAQVPFHYWLPGAMAAPGPVSAYLHSATLVKAGVFLLLRLQPVLGTSEVWHVTLGHVGAVTMLLGALFAFFQQDLKRLLAYSTVSGLGAIVMLIGIGTPPAIRAALLFTAVHALYKAALFMLVGYMEKRTGTRDVYALRGLARSLPLAFGAALLAGLSMSGLPPLLGAISKELVYEAKLGAPEAPWVLAAVGALANALIIACALLVAVGPFLRRGPAPTLQKAPSVRLLLGPILLALTSLALGLAHASDESPLVDAALAGLAPRAAEPALSLDPDASWVKLLSLATLAAGVLLFTFRRKLVHDGSPVVRLAHRAPGGVQDALVERIYALGRVVAAVSETQVARRSVLLAGVLVAVAGIAFVVQAAPTPPVSPLSVSFEEAALLLLIAGGALATLFARTQLRAVASLGVTGAGVAMVFLVRGGPDLALTQLAVETLAVLLLLSVLPRGKVERIPAPRRRQLLDGGISILVGLTFAAVAWAATPSGELRPMATEIAEASEPLGRGLNVVNVILVDFRALDTLGELVVLAIAALGIAAMVPRPTTGSTLSPSLESSPILRNAARVLVPLLALLSLVLFVRGHNEPGGGFVAGLVAAAAVVLRALVSPVSPARHRERADQLMFTGLAIAFGSGLLGMLLGGSFLQGAWLEAKVPAFGKLGTPVLFDAGVFLVVLGVVTSVLFHLLGRKEG